MNLKLKLTRLLHFIYFQVSIYYIDFIRIIIELSKYCIFGDQAHSLKRSYLHATHCTPTSYLFFICIAEVPQFCLRAIKY